MIAAIGIGILFGLAIGSLIGAVLIRAAVSVVNKILGPGEAPLSDAPFVGTGRIESYAPSDSSNPYSTPSQTAHAPDNGPLAVPEPSFGRAVAIALVATILGFAVNFFLGVISPPELAVAVSLASLALNFVIVSFVFSQMLPTSFGKAAFIYVMYIAIALVVGIVIAGIVIGVGLIQG